jgi:hypothetical protein
MVREGPADCDWRFPSATGSTPPLVSGTAGSLPELSDTRNI